MDITARYQGHGKWIGLIKYTDLTGLKNEVIMSVDHEVYRTGGSYATALEAIAACCEWWEERERWGSAVPAPDGSFSLA